MEGKEQEKEIFRAKTDDLKEKNRRIGIINQWRKLDLAHGRNVNRIFLYKDESIIDYLKRRVMDCEEPCFLICYSNQLPTGSGKSNAVLSLALMLDPDFDINHNLVFTAKQFKDRLINLTRGEAIIWDEAGIGGGKAIEHYKEINKTISDALRLARFKQGYVFFITPLTRLLDIDIRMLSGLELEMHFVDHLKKKSYGSFRSLMWAMNKYGKYEVIKMFPYELPLKRKEQENWHYISTWTFNKVDNEIWNQYLERKLEALGKLDEVSEPKKNSKAKKLEH